jgi:ribulose-5-phosphate 4-epimerase/fuculose-1-phosphate aldolase
MASARVRESATREQIAVAGEAFGHDVFLLANHGATTLGPTVEVAYNRMESLEHSARILLAARLLGRVRTLTAEQVRDLVAAGQGARRRGPHGGLTPHGDGLETE